MQLLKVVIILLASTWVLAFRVKKDAQKKVSSGQASAHASNISRHDGASVARDATTHSGYCDGTWYKPWSWFNYWWTCAETTTTTTTMAVGTPPECNTKCDDPLIKLAEGHCGKCRHVKNDEATNKAHCFEWEVVSPGFGWSQCCKPYSCGTTSTTTGVGLTPASACNTVCDPADVDVPQGHCGTCREVNNDAQTGVAPCFNWEVRTPGKDTSKCCVPHKCAEPPSCPPKVELDLKVFPIGKYCCVGSCRSSRERADNSCCKHLEPAHDDTWSDDWA